MNITHDIATKVAPDEGNVITLITSNFASEVEATFEDHGGDDVFLINVSEQAVDADDCREIAEFFQKLSLVLDGEATEADLEG